MLASDVRAERKRFKGQAAKILARLEQGPATNRELAAISLKYTSRISQLRLEMGCDIRCSPRNYETGATVYTLWTDGMRWGATVGECDEAAERHLRGL